MKNSIIITWILFLLAGCGKQGEKSGSGDSTFQVQKQMEIRFDVKPLDESGLKQLIARRNGKFLFLNVWATWCAPCREEFPVLIKLTEEYKHSNVEFVGLSVDYPDEIESKIIPFLEKHNCNFKIYVQNFKDERMIIQLLNKEWSGAIPATFIFDPEGTQQAFLFGKGSYEDFKQSLEKIRSHQ
jgi:thiol-disulfide isomerase/thioredoxin